MPVQPRILRVYESLLEARSNNRRILQCVLRPEAKTNDVPSNRPVITCDELATQALALYRAEVPFSLSANGRFLQ